jgi:ethanolamine-phosphate cytidylyltransferase
MSGEDKKLRIWVDGCFDMMHWGHANAIRQAKKEGHFLVVGVHSDAEILANKGPTVMKEEERYEAVRACKWVDQVVPDSPYVTSLEYMDKYKCDVCIHGDDLVTTPDGKDTYQAIKDANRFKTVPRTEGVSTTALVRRMLQATQSETSSESVRISFTRGEIAFFSECAGAILMIFELL